MIAAYEVTQIEVGRQHIDFMGHVNNAQYLSWAQEIALEYWRKYVPAEAQSKLAWVAAEHTIRYKLPARAQDILQAHAAVLSVGGCRVRLAVRFSCDGRSIAELESTWCCVHATQYRPAKIPDEIIVQFREFTEGAMS